jgi:hypothetical protein
MRLAPLVLPALVLCCLTGCANSVYYQSRYAPTSSSQSFGVGERIFWTEDKEVYELPANPPAISTDEEDEHRSRRDCLQPGQNFKAPQVASGGGTEIRGLGGANGPKVAAMADESGIHKAPGPGPAVAIAGWEDEARYGTRERTFLVPVAGNQGPITAAPGSGINRIPPNRVAGIGDDTGWCPPAK